MDPKGPQSEEIKSESFLPEADEIIEAEYLTQNVERKDDEEATAVDGDDESHGSYGVSAYGISAASGTTAAASKRGLPKLREILQRQKQDSEDEDTPDIDYLYDDEDSFGAEIAELYSYTEGPEFHLTQKAFEDISNNLQLPPTWNGMDSEQKSTMIQSLLERTEVASRDDRLAALRGLLYVSQGCWLECQSDSECLNQCKTNVILLYKEGVFASAVELLGIEME